MTERLGTGAGPIVVDELTALAALTPEQQALLCEAARDRRYSAPPQLPDVWPRLSAADGYVEYARHALETAARHIEAIHAGTVPYRADKAFTAPEVDALGNAVRVALLRDEPWLPSLLDRLLPGVVVAPTAARTLPSQALLYEIARAGEEFPTPELVTALRSARATTRHAGVPKQLERTLRRVEAALAERTDVALRLPDFQLDADGTLRREVGGCAGVVRVTTRAELGWERDGRTLRSVPATVRQGHPDVVRELRDLVKRLNTHLDTLTRALEGGYAVDTVHRYDRWRAHLVGHPVAVAVAGRLVWEVECRPGVWQAVLPALDELPDAAAQASVRLWHPLRSEPESVLSWRDRLVSAELRQPFKQVFRESYPLTAAERASGDHSLRFAAHLVHYRRLFALFRARGWRSNLLGPWDGGGDDTAKRTLAGGAWQVRLAHALSDDDPELAVTGRVRFARRTQSGWCDARLEEVPPLVFSEAMRDVDLFVAVTSIAADPDWIDPDGPDAERRRSYRERFGLAELTASALVRREVLGRIVPRLRIAGRCVVEARHLVVRGELATYRIHLGSANVVMEPSGAYVCIVPSGGAGAGRVFLPFEDERLSLILSKALLLANDTRITDESILAQIRRGA
ncbi:DUF4132 domain-containing protein [Streptacidiphilus jiangxiensis]|uniref:Uncharacterized protein n=1 Tax=Streptacidiphilus jiangxiensis TaxID=235985 RepID=A0A1H7QHL2_STRJI|nr:DUF4132 domain-containing protein [Streptacidiphilus jiangxiensis]SEL47433.1 protein of unknown function [Streptacidiphilus jiangxiensis]